MLKYGGVSRTWCVFFLYLHYLKTKTKDYI